MRKHINAVIFSFISVFIIFTSMPTFAQEQGSPSFIENNKSQILAQYENAFLKEKGGIKILSVEGSPYEMGFQHGWLLGKVYGEQVLHNWSLTITGAAYMLGGGTLQTGRTRLQMARDAIRPYVPDELKNEMMGIADGLQEAWPECPLTYEDIFLINIHVDALAAAWQEESMDKMDIFKPYDLEYGPSDTISSVEKFNFKKLAQNNFSTQDAIPSCSSFSIWDEATLDGELIAAGTQDWSEYSTDLFGEFGNIWDGNLILIAKPDDGYAFAGTSAMLLIGCCQGWNEDGITVAQKTSQSINETLCGLGEFFQCRMLIQHSGSVDDAINFLSGPNNRTRGLNWEVTDAKDRIGASIEISATEVAVRYGDTGYSMVSTNNYFCFPGFQGYQGHNIVEGQFQRGWRGYEWPLELDEWLNIVSNDHRFFTYHGLIDQNYGTIDIDDAKYFLTQCTGVGEKAIMAENIKFFKTEETGDIYLQKMSVQRFVAKLGNGLNVWASYGGTQPDDLGPWVHINLNKEFKKNKAQNKKHQQLH